MAPAPMAKPKRNDETPVVLSFDDFAGPAIKLESEEDEPSEAEDRMDPLMDWEMIEWDYAPAEIKVF